MLAYELVVGRPPFEVKDEAKTASAIMYSNDFPLPSKYSAQWAAFVKQACRLLNILNSGLSVWHGGPSVVEGRLGITHWSDRNGGGSGPLSMPLRGGGRLSQALMKNPALRPSAAQLLEHPWVKQHTARAEAVLLPELDLPALSLSKRDLRYQVLTPPQMRPAPSSQRETRRVWNATPDTSSLEEESSYTQADYLCGCRPPIKVAGTFYCCTC